LTNTNLFQRIRFLVDGLNLIAYGRSIDIQGYIVDNIPTIKEYMDKKDPGHFSICNKKYLRYKLSLKLIPTNIKSTTIGSLHYVD